MSPVKLNIAANDDVVEIRKYLAGYASALNIEKGGFKSDWLLSDVYDDKWILRTNKTIVMPNGEYKYTMMINWVRSLADGSILTDDSNIKFRRFIQEICFYYRDATTVSKVTSNVSLSTLMPFVFGMVSWVFKPELGMEPNRYYLSRLTQEKFKEYFEDYLAGGVFNTLATGKKVLSQINNDVGGKITTPDILSLSGKEKRVVIQYLDVNNLYSINNYNCRYVDREKLCNYFDLCRNELFGHKATLFLRQFEPQISQKSPDVLIPVNLDFECPGHTTPLISDVRNHTYSKKNAMAVLNFLSSMFKLKGIYNKELPNLETIRYMDIRNLIEKKGSDSSLTPWIPLSTSLELINQSIGYILKHGEKVIELYDSVLMEMLRHNLLSRDSLTTRQRERRDKIVSKYLEELSVELNIKGFSNGQKNNDGQTKYELGRSAPSIQQAIDHLYGACLIAIAGLKPIRVNEISSLKYSCITYKKGDGYWLEHELEKSGIEDQRQVGAKPIPKIVAKAIQQLQKLNKITVKYSTKKSKKESEYLLYYLTYSGISNASVMNDKNIRRLLSVFCDYIELPTDCYGRRWYVNTHELRKSFLLTFFWTFKFSTLDACSWIAGHKDPAQILGYIEANMPGEEMVEVEAEYAKQQLRLFTADHSLTEMENIEALYQDVCTYFNVASVSLIKETELKEWLEYAIEAGVYKIHAYNIESEDSYLTANVAVSIQERDHES
jgi:hypothetical protein